MADEKSTEHLEADGPCAGAASKRCLLIALLKVGAVLFVAEFAVMRILPMLALPRGVWEDATDSFLLALLGLPALYVLGFRPHALLRVHDLRQYTRTEKRTLGLLLGYVAVVMVMAGVQGSVGSGQDAASVVVNHAGRQRMISQRLAKAAMLRAMQSVETAARNAENTERIESLADRFERVLRGLIDGDAELGLPPCTSKETRGQLEAVQTAWRPLKALLGEMSDPHPRVAVFPDARALEAASDRVLVEMDRAVKLLELHYGDRARLLEMTQGLSIVSAGLIGALLVVSFVQMMRHRRRLYAGLAESEARTRAIVTTAADGIITIDEKGTIESFNAAAERIFGYRAEEVMGKNVKMLMPSPYREDHDANLMNYVSGLGKTIMGTNCEVAGLRKDGTTFPMYIAVSEARVGDRRLFAGIVQDITDRKEAERRLRETVRELERFNRAAVGRELRMIELKHEINELLQATGQGARYKIPACDEGGPRAFDEQVVADA